ncbi:mitochondrial division protein 1 [Sporothrix schenckii 1099-18]|uniref:Mitochondrial division protein 1 n=1 Tax=Sporothrix schenckii 1099-18 TaxID=1397361 RepID=A0A0F2LYC1_SPOSC|nr:mitochondrial division protein 1 [Sporothrix schenckii 1099-18]KJR81480.1 mitochondrial division protein 1 [Sporothrix schenckii 1099-18]
MANDDSHHDYHDDLGGDEDTSIISAAGIEAFGRKVTTTASHLMGPSDPSANAHYKSAMSEVHRQLRRPHVQRSVLAMARTTPTDMVRSRLSTSEIRHRALSYLPEEMLQNIPEDDNAYSLFQGFQATFPEMTEEGKKHGHHGHGTGGHRRRSSRGRKMLDDKPSTPDGPHALHKMRKDKAAMMHQFEMLGIRKNMAGSEIRDIDIKVANLAGMRKILLDRLAALEQDEALLEHDIMDLEGRIDIAQELADEAETLAANSPTKSDVDLALDNDDDEDGVAANGSAATGFMSQSIYEKLPSAGSTPSRSTAGRRTPKAVRKKSMPILHEHFHPGTSIREIRAHQDAVTAIDFDAPFGTLVSAGMDDTVRVWDLNAGRCIGLLEGHTASVRTLQVEDNILATGSADATIRLWDLSRSRYDPHGSLFSKSGNGAASGGGGGGGGGAADDDDDDDGGIAFENPDDEPVEPPADSMADCPLMTLSAHMGEITALHFRGDVLVSGSSDKTMRQWDLEKGRCVQTLDVMWAAAQASASVSSSSAAGTSEGTWRQTSRAQTEAADFVGAVQVFDAALACGTADGMVRLWDLRSGQVHRSLVGHTGPVTCLQFDDVHLVTGSVDRSIRIWDLRTGSIYDAYAYDNPVTSMMFDARRIVSAAGEDVVKVYDKVEGRQWDCGAGITAAEDGHTAPAIVEHVRIRDGYMVEGRRDGRIGVWTC